MTTLELARAIADAAVNAHQMWRYGMAGPMGRDDNMLDPPTQAVLKTLEAHDSWFCRLTNDEHGITVETPYPRQPELFK